MVASEVVASELSNIMDNSNNNSFSSPMFITERAQFSLYSQIMLSYLAVKECSDVVRDGFIPPSSDKAKAFKEYQGMEERAYGAITLSLMKMPHIYQAVVSHSDVQPTVAYPFLRGSAAWKRVKAEFWRREISMCSALQKPK